MGAPSGERRCKHLGRPNGEIVRDCEDVDRRLAVYHCDLFGSCTPMGIAAVGLATCKSCLYWRPIPSESEPDTV